MEAILITILSITFLDVGTFFLSSVILFLLYAIAVGLYPVAKEAKGAKKYILMFFIIIALIIGYPGDIAFNLIYGTAWFRRLPKVSRKSRHDFVNRSEWTLSKRLKTTPMIQQIPKDCGFGPPSLDGTTLFGYVRTYYIK